MTIRTDVTIDWSSSPRVLTVASPSVEISVQDIVDTCRNFEDDPRGLSELKLVDAAGKEPLGGGTRVGITATLQNTVVAFEARAGPTWVLCSISGGNLVAVDDVNAEIDPRSPTAYVTVDRTASASATLQEQAALNYASFNGGVTVDISLGISGTAFPTGTAQQPVDNFADALTIAGQRGFGTFYINGDATIDSANDFDNFVFVGETQIQTEMTVDSDASVESCEFYDATVVGTLDGNNKLKNCIISTLNYINGIIEQCILESGTITLGGGAEAHFLDCWSGVAGTSTPIIDMGGSGQELSMRNYYGGIKLTNKSGSEPVSIDLSSGQIVLASTITNGTIVCRGIGKLVDESGDPISSGSWNGATIVNELLNSYVEELHALQGLDPDNPLTVTPTTRDAGDISQVITGDGETSTTVTRQ